MAVLEKTGKEGKVAKGPMSLGPRGVHKRDPIPKLTLDYSSLLTPHHI